MNEIKIITSTPHSHTYVNNLIESATGKVNTDQNSKQDIKVRHKPQNNTKNTLKYFDNENHFMVPVFTRLAPVAVMPCIWE